MGNVKAILGICAVMGLLAYLLTLSVGCGHFPPDPACQGDPALKPCPCMDPRTPDCPPVPSDSHAKKHPDAGATK